MTFHEKLTNPETRLDTLTDFANKFYRSCQETNNPPGTWRAGEDENQTFDRLASYADKIANYHSSRTWEEIERAWDKGINNQGMKPMPFNIPNLYYFLQEYLPKQSTMSKDVSEPPPDWPTTPEGVLNRMLPTFESALNGDPIMGDHVFAGGIFKDIEKVIHAELGIERVKEIRDEVSERWQNDIFEKTGMQRKENEKYPEFLERLAKGNRWGFKLPDFALNFRKAVVMNLIQLRKEKLQ